MFKPVFRPLRPELLILVIAMQALSEILENGITRYVVDRLPVPTFTFEIPDFIIWRVQRRLERTAEDLIDVLIGLFLASLCNQMLLGNLFPSYEEFTAYFTQWEDLLQEQSF